MTPVPLISAGIPDETALAMRSEIINLIPEALPQGGRSGFVLRTPPGMRILENVGQGSIRGIYAMGGVLYVVAGERLFSVDANGIRTNIGTILGSSRVGFSDGFIPDTSRFLAIGTGDDGYIYDTVDGLTKITDTDFTDRVVPSTPAYVGGYMVWPTEDGFLPSDLLAPLAYSAANFQTAESSTDGVVALKAVYGDLWVFGGKTIEVYGIASSGSTIFQRLQTIEYGCGAPHAITLADNGVFWLDQNKRVYRANGYSPVRVSTHQLEQDLKEQDVTSAFMFSWIDRGHEFVALTIPDGKTFVYDCATQMWHRRKTEGTDRWLPNGVANCYGETFFADFDSGQIFMQDYSLVREGGHRLIREFYTGYLHKNGDPLMVSALLAVVDTGNAEQTGDLDQTDPVIEMRYTDKAKSEWTNWKSRSLGRIGEYAKQIRWFGLGSIGRKGKSAQRGFHFRVSDPVKSDFIALGIEGQ
ncbi:MAG TPA: hypothetical protein VJM31_00040 [Vicinamibacterales bacterium]|nr:hypothetical protein [Vicinamibacterales bacterium]